MFQEALRRPLHPTRSILSYLIDKNTGVAVPQEGKIYNDSNVINAHVIDNHQMEFTRWSYVLDNNEDGLLATRSSK